MYERQMRIVSGSATARAVRRGSVRILVVEDDRKVARFVRQGLCEEGHAVEIAADGPEALDLALGDPATRQVTRGERRIELTARQYTLLEYFLRNPGRVLSRQMIGQHVWGLAFDAESNVIDVSVGYLRRKIDRDPERRLLHTVRGAGYVLQVEE